MKLYIKQKVWSWAENFDIYDADLEPVFYVAGRALAWSDQFKIYLQGEEEAVAEVKQKFPAWHHTMDLYVKGKQLARVKKTVSFFKPRFVVEGLDWAVEGDVWAHSYQIKDQSGQAIAQIKKKVWSFSDSFEIDIQSEEPLTILTALAVVLAVDSVLDQAH